MPNETQRHNAKAADAYFNKKKVEGAYDGPIKYAAKVKKDKPSHMLDIPIFGADGSIKLPKLKYRNKNDLDDSAMKSPDKEKKETSSFVTDESMQNYDDNYDPSEFKYINQDVHKQKSYFLN